MKSLWMLMGTFLASNAAWSACIVDEKAAEAAADAVAYTRLCPEFNRIHDNRVLDLFIALKAVDPSSRGQFTCNAAVVNDAGLRGARLLSAEQSERDAFCQRATVALANDSVLRETLGSFGLIK